jgi:hypothetical protein
MKDPEKERIRLKIYRETHREYVAANKKAWYEAHKEEMNAKSKLRHLANRDADLAAMKLRYHSDRERNLAEQKAYRAANHEKVIARGRAYYYKHREKRLAENKAYRDANPDKRKNSRLRYSFGISLEEYNDMLKAQGGVCAICSKLCKSGRYLAVDHDHVTGKVRALLCSNCNILVGHLQDSQDLVYRLLDYLKKHQGDVLSGTA